MPKALPGCGTNWLTYGRRFIGSPARELDGVEMANVVVGVADCQISHPGRRGEPPGRLPGTRRIPVHRPCRKPYRGAARIDLRTAGDLSEARRGSWTGLRWPT